MPRQSEEAKLDRLNQLVYERTCTIGELLQMDGVPRDLLSAEALLQLCGIMLTESMECEEAARYIEEFAGSVRRNARTKI